MALKHVGAVNKERYNKNCQSSVHLFVHYTYSKKCMVRSLKKMNVEWFVSLLCNKCISCDIRVIISSGIELCDIR